MPKESQILFDISTIIIYFLFKPSIVLIRAIALEIVAMSDNLNIVESVGYVFSFCTDMGAHPCHVFDFVASESQTTGLRRWGDLGWDSTKPESDRAHTR